ncbi:MAG: hypothetical protein WCT77_14855 [Bacteroidota bacterium]
MINLNLHKILEAISKIKIPILTILIAVICSFNLWFLTIFFFKNNILLTYGLTITLLISFAFTIAWCLITGITAQKFYLLNILILDPKSLTSEDNENDDIDNIAISFTVFAEIILLHSFFIYLAYCFSWNFLILISVMFWFSVLQFLIVDVSLKIAYSIYLKKEQENSLKSKELNS